MNKVSPTAGVIDIALTPEPLKYLSLPWTDNCRKKAISGSDVSNLKAFFGCSCWMILFAGVSNSTDNIFKLLI